MYIRAYLTFTLFGVLATFFMDIYKLHFVYYFDYRVSECVMVGMGRTGTSLFEQMICKCIVLGGKAFDVVPHKRLFHNLDHYGIRGSTLYIQIFLTTRSQTTVIDGTLSCTLAGYWANSLQYLRISPVGPIRPIKACTCLLTIYQPYWVCYIHMLPSRTLAGYWANTVSVGTTTLF